VTFTTKKTRRAAPVRAIVYGRGGLGKSTLASQAPSPVFVASEEGLENIDAVAVEPYPRTWEDVLAALDYVGTLDHETLAVDSLDWIEPLCWDYVCRKSKKYADIEAFGYGKGYIAALDQWRVFRHKLDGLRTKNMHIILIAHAHRKPYKNPLGDDYEHWTIKLHEKAAGLLVEWADVVGFCDEDIATDDTSGRVKAQTTGRRIIRTNPHPAYLAKTRFAMPAKIPLSWSALAQAVHEGGPAAVERLTSEFEAKVRELGDADVEKGARAFLAKAGMTVPSLTEAIGTLDGYLEERRKSA
jgi:hypothetical protein